MQPVRRLGPVNARTMAEDLSADERIAIIRQNLQEVLRLDIIEDVIKHQNRPLCIYWGRPDTVLLQTIMINSLLRRNRNNRPTPLWLLHLHRQDSTFPARRLQSKTTSRRHSWLPRQSQSSHRACRTPRCILQIRHNLASQVDKCTHRKARFCSWLVVPIVA